MSAAGEPRQIARMLDDIPRQITARLAREYIRATLLEPMIGRVFEIGMGITTFEVIAPGRGKKAARRVRVEAPAAVQVQALLGLTALGVPTQLGLVDDDGNTLPGVVALGELDLVAAQETALGGRFTAVAQALGNGNGNGNGAAPEPAPESFEVVEVDEVDAATARMVGDVAPPPIKPNGLTPEQVILARRRAARRKK